MTKAGYTWHEFVCSTQKQWNGGWLLVAYANLKSTSNLKLVNNQVKGQQLIVKSNITLVTGSAMQQPSTLLASDINRNAWN